MYPIVIGINCFRKQSSVLCTVTHRHFRNLSHSLTAIQIALTKFINQKNVGSNKICTTDPNFVYRSRYQCNISLITCHSINTALATSWQFPDNGLAVRYYLARPERFLKTSRPMLVKSHFRPRRVGLFKANNRKSQGRSDKVKTKVKKNMV